MPTWLAILIGAAVTLTGVFATWGTLGLKLLDSWDGAAKWKGEVDADRKSFKKFMERIGRDISALRDELRTYFLEERRPLIRPGSPLELTEYGKEISKELSGETWASTISGSVTDKLRDSDAYEIQQFCFGFVESAEYSDEERTLIREIAYRHGLTEGNILRILAIEIRDKVLEAAGLDAPD